jgi:hypothetical protein
MPVSYKIRFKEAYLLHRTIGTDFVKQVEKKECMFYRKAFTAPITAVTGVPTAGLSLYPPL